MNGPVRQARVRPPLAWRLIINAVVWFLRGVFGWRIQARPPAVRPNPEQPLVVLFNHTSAIDGFLVADRVWRHLHHWIQPLVKAELLDLPLLGGLARRAGAIGVHRGDNTGRETAYDDAVAQLRAGGTVTIAPEGTITHDGSLLPLRHGAARLALDAGVDVLVVTHFGAQRAFSPVVRTVNRGAIVTMAMDLISPRPDEDATSLTGRIAATMMDRSEELRATYPKADPSARWWPPYASPASPSSTARENLERYQESMAEAVAHARERMAQIAEEHELEQKVTEARERAIAVAEDVAARSRAGAETIAEHARERVEELADHAKERVTALHLLPTDGVGTEGPDETAVGTDDTDPA
jgi:1-acyl-sn-glycerol-3-phosphate acyltransferase